MAVDMREKSHNLRGKVYIRTFGCQMNEYDTLKLLKLLEGDYEAAGTPDEADLIVINTCSVREKPEHKVYSLLGEIGALKAKKPGLIVGVGGCVAQQEGEKLASGRNGADFVFGTHNISLVPHLVRNVKEGRGAQIAIDYRDGWEELPLGFGEGSRVSVYVAISRGCNKNCSFCIVPRTRGPEVSRDPEEILREIRILAARGAKEVILLGQTVNSYGRDLKPRLSFVGLMERIAGIDGIERIRFTSPHPQEVRDDLIAFMAECGKVCKHIHMPLQSGSDKVLKLMNRNYRVGRFLQIIDQLRDRIPDIAISTDLIVGFPGESKADFEMTLDVMDRVRFSSSYSFAFSPRPGTKAAEMKDVVPQEEKASRLKILQSRQMDHTSAFLEGWIGKDVEILIDGSSASDTNILRGRTSQNTVVNLDRPYADLREGMIVSVRIIGKAKNTLKGALVI
ncbi:MAG: tRNA (N6-isopentenyl adenosine(37)-C2)-methylthiotransferase MiaB [Candidatus Dadabacteria bacterium]|nr:MAG: tRNA (N6-isopentenyl adenosine(37)-C2)-methylthiotransferase MiaB [Candidatus Dadabacteria bacterium]